MSFKNLSKAELSTVVDLIKQNNPYREILKKFPNLKSTSKINRIKRIYINGETPEQKKLSEKTKRKIQITALERKFIQKSDIIINKYINVPEGFNYSIKNLEEVHNKHKNNSDDLVIELQRLNAKVSKLKLDDEVQFDLLNEIHNSITKVSDLFRHSDRRIRAIEGLRRQLETFVKLRIEVEALTQVKELIDSFLEGCGVLPDEWYFKYKEAVIRNNIFAREFFSKYEGFYESGESEEEEVILEKD